MTHGATDPCIRLDRPPPPGFTRVLHAFRAVRAEPLTTRKCPENGSQYRHPAALENLMRSPTSPAVRSPAGA